MYAAISSVDRLQAEPESLRKWREEQRERLEELGEEPRTWQIRRDHWSLNADMPSHEKNWQIFSLFADANSRMQEVEWKEKAMLELEEWHTRQNEQLEKTKVNNRYTTQTI